MALHFGSQRTAAHFTGWLLAVTVIVCRLLPMCVQTGMFFDGVTYATIARNMAIGAGDLWHPTFLVKGASDTNAFSERKPVDFAFEVGFYEHPPLAFWLESLFFRLLGDHYWVERLFSALTAIGTAVIIAAIWRLLFRVRPEFAEYNWLPVVWWTAIPTWAWLYGSNMLENTLGLFAIMSVYASLRAACGGPRTMIGWTVLAAGCVLGAVLCKGPVGLYPLATPVLYAIAYRKRERREIVAAVILPATFAALFDILLLHAPAYQFLKTYYHVQVEASLAGQREIFASPFGHFSALRKIVQQVWGPAIVAAGLIMWARRRRMLGDDAVATRPDGAQSIRPALYFFLLTAASSSLPIAISPKQLGHYVAPSYPYFALALAAACCEAVAFLMHSGRDAEQIARYRRRIHWVCGSVICGMAILTCALAGRSGRDKDLYRDTLAIGQILPPATVVGIGPELSQDWPLRSYLARWDQVAAVESDVPREYCLTLKGNTPPPGYEPVETGLVRYQLNHRVDSTDSVAERIEEATVIRRR